VQSKYVNEEIRHYKALGRAERIIPVIVEGEPGGLNRECFPAALKFKVDADGSLTSDAEKPIAADARPSGDGSCHGYAPRRARPFYVLLVVANPA
jgi:hypothetical protein